MTTPNYKGAVAWYIVTAADQADVPDFVFSSDAAPYFMAQASDGRIFVFDRAEVLVLITKWQEADSEMRAMP